MMRFFDRVTALLDEFARGIDQAMREEFSRAQQNDAEEVRETKSTSTTSQGGFVVTRTLEVRVTRMRRER